jgi:peptidoglycan/LPS O-acetylase OafA/YrhL
MWMLIERAPNRIQSLDGLRCIAALVVVVHHYCARWTQPIEPQSLYPYGSLFAHFPISEYGYLGVQLFFVISGFVIALTLYRSPTFYEFAVRRLARLWPTMLLCSAATYTALALIPQEPFTVSLFNFIPSLTFIAPDVFNFITRSNHFDWMDGAYWSLFVEIRFYALIGALYFLDRARFARNLIYASTASLGAYALALLFGQPLLASALKAALITQHLPWFLIGIGFYFKHIGKPFRSYFLLAALGLISQLVRLDASPTVVLAVSDVIIPGLVWIGLCTRIGNRLFSLRWLAGIGSASYSLYLLHQRIGVALIHWLGADLHGWTTIGLAVFVAALVISAALIIFRYWETPWNRRIVSNLTDKRPPLVRAHPQTHT